MKSSRYLIAALAISVAINLALLGFVLGRASNLDRPAMRVDPQLGVGRLLRDMPAERREAIEPLVKDYFRSLRPRMRQVQRAQGAIRDAILTEPFDAEAMADALGTFNTRLYESQARGHPQLVRLLAALSIEERRELVQRFRRPRERQGPMPAPRFPGHPPGPAMPP